MQTCASPCYLRRQTIRQLKARNFFSELKRRKVYRVAVTYAVVGWVLIQIVTQVFPFFLPLWTTRAAIALIGLGFPMALILSWLFDLTLQGVSRTEDLKLPPEGSQQQGLVSSIASPSPVTNKSVAVLPFENLSDNPESAYFAEGVHDDILTSLARIADLKVISRTSVQQYRTGPRNLREIARALGVAHILQGTVRRQANRVRVNAQLINAQSDSHVWGDSFDRELTDLFAIQSELAERISTALRVNLSAQEKASLQIRPTHDLVAYELYLRARNHFQWSGIGDAQESGERALPLLDEAIARDPKFALAHALISRVHAELYWFGYDKRPSRLVQAKTAAEAALRLQPELGEGHLALAFYYYYSSRDYKRARTELMAAQRAAPNDSEVIGAMGIVSRREACWDEAIGHVQRARELDPRNMSTIWNSLETYIFVGSYAEAERSIADGLLVSPNAHFIALARASLALRREGNPKPLSDALRSIPADFDPGGAVTTIAVRVALMQANYDDAAHALARSQRDWLNDAGLSGMAGTIDGYVMPRSWFAGLIAHRRGEHTESKRSFEQANEAVRNILTESPDDPRTLAMLGLILGALDQKEDAIRYGERAAELLPVENDAVDGPVIATNLAAIYAAVGEQERAIAQLKRVTGKPAGPTRGLLRAEPEWAPLRNTAGFDHLA